MRALVLLALSWAPTALCKACEGENLPPNAPMKSGVKFKPEDCTIKAKPGDIVKMHYVGTLYSDCTKFDSSVDRDFPFTVQLPSDSLSPLLYLVADASSATRFAV